jgi:membrane-associated protein
MNDFAVSMLGGAGPVQPQLASFLPDWLNPQVFLADPALAPWVVLLVCGIVFAETGLLVGFFLPGDSMLFTAGLLVATGTIKFNVWLFALLIRPVT